MNLIVVYCLQLALILMSSQIIYARELREAKLRCQMERVHNMLAFNCADMKLNEIPKNLKENTEVRKDRRGCIYNYITNPCFVSGTGCVRK